MFDRPNPGGLGDDIHNAAALQSVMVDHWMSIAAVGHPNEQWPGFEASSQWPVMQFDASPAVRFDDSPAYCRVWDSVQQWTDAHYSC